MVFTLFFIFDQNVVLIFLSPHLSEKQLSITDLTKHYLYSVSGIVSFVMLCFMGDVNDDIGCDVMVRLWLCFNLPSPAPPPPPAEVRAHQSPAEEDIDRGAVPRGAGHDALPLPLPQQQQLQTGARLQQQPVS